MKKFKGFLRSAAALVMLMMFGFSVVAILTEVYEILGVNVVLGAFLPVCTWSEIKTV